MRFNRGICLTKYKNYEVSYAYLDPFPGIAIFIYVV
jgi:hypothetical protein